MRILVTGRGGSGSWQVRGEQIGRALGARVVALAGLNDMRQADVILVVKRVPDELLHNLRRSGRPWVYDVVDAYPQPASSAWSKRHAVDWLRAHVHRLQPARVIWANAQMQRDAGGGGAVVYHHARPGQAINPVRNQLRTIGYEGSEAYIGPWVPAIERICRERGMQFVVNPPSLADLDVVLALRGPDRGGYVTRSWKSNVKLANAHATGTPFIGSPECGYQETATGAEHWAETPADLERALDWLIDQQARLEISTRFRRAAISLEQAAAQVREVLCAAKS